MVRLHGEKKQQVQNHSEQPKAEEFQAKIRTKDVATSSRLMMVVLSQIAYSVQQLHEKEEVQRKCTRA